MALRRGRPVEQVCNRKETTWYENHVVRVSESNQNWESSQGYTANQRRLTIRLARECKHWHPLALGRRYWARRSPLSEYMSLHLSLKFTTNCVPLSKIKWDIYIFYKEVCFVCSLKFVRYLWLCSCLGLWEVYNSWYAIKHQPRKTVLSQNLILCSLSLFSSVRHKLNLLVWLIHLTSLCCLV